MNIIDYRRGMDRITPNAELKERIMNQTKKKYIPIHRTLTVALAAALTAACLFTVALAASPELRTAVLSFFHMEEREQLPGQSGAVSEPGISQADIGQTVKAQYIKMDKYYGISGNLLNDLTWNDERTALLSYKFWEIKDNELIPVEVNMQTSQVDITHNGIHYQGEFWWFVHEGQLDFFTGDNRIIDEDGEHEWDWNLSWIPGRTDAVLLRLSTGRQMEYREYPFLYHLDTGKTEDLFANVDPGVMEQSDGAIWSDDFRLAVITSRASEEFHHGREWLYNRESGTLTDVSTLGGVGADSAAFTDDDTLILYDLTDNADGGVQSVSAYSYDISSGRTVQTLEQTPYCRSWYENPSGVMTFGSRCVLISETGQVQVVDLKTGDRTLLDGFTFQTGDDFMVSPSGNKLLYFAMDSASAGLGISQLGMVDLEEGKFFAFDREGYENLYESGIGWSDDNTVSINANSLDEETRYLFLYTF
ncbi:hypothetical protein D1641_05530 [Colidextribacter sp. OB.20]|uniref:hypothetical protein n=1 Tax=Colidextribacter sp. OB.20 TaxID=2304568 RepID=UPI00136E920F|nr:hypothetical protein [Colidextribacter sp. OB.20]NBI09483.1 hypothetical protein [Colidextribacter sp. OB.20]